jgi:hypothetical protein
VYIYRDAAISLGEELDRLISQIVVVLLHMNTKEAAHELLGLDKVNQVDYVAISAASPERTSTIRWRFITG